MSGAYALTSSDLLESLLSLLELSDDSMNLESMRKGIGRNMYICGSIISGTLRNITVHVHPKNSEQLWLHFIEAAKRMHGVLSRGLSISTEDVVQSYAS